MPSDRTAQTLIQPIKPRSSKELTAVPAVPSFSFSDANSILDIEIQADQLLAYINKLTSLADQACTTAIRQNETTQLVEENRRSEMINLRNHLDQQSAQIHEQRLALVRLEHESKSKIAILETKLQETESHRSEQTELERLRSENANLARRLRLADLPDEQHPSRIKEDIDSLNQELAALRQLLTTREETIQTKDGVIQRLEVDFRTKIVALEQSLRETQTELKTQEAKLKDKEVLIHAAAAKEAEIGNLIKRLSTECSKLSYELHEKNRRLVEIESKQPQPPADTKIWRRVIGHLQEDPQ
jgi:chromosome segregation ATPase